MKKYIVIREFADKNNLSKHYREGEELPAEFGEERLKNIVKLGLAKVEDEDAGAGKDTPTDIDLSEKVADLLPKIRVFADVEKLKQYLETEKAAREPRKMILKAIEERLDELVVVKE